MTALLAVTLGNTSVAVARADGSGAPDNVRREPLERLGALVNEHLNALGGADATVAVCSVNPEAMEQLRELAAGAGTARIRVAGEDFPITIETDVDEPRRVGADRLLAALAAYRRTGDACIVVDAGTAVTVDAVDAAGTFLGGAILPGPDLMARALADGTAQLPHVDVRAEVASESAIGKNTESAIRAGVVHGCAGAVRALAQVICAELGCAAPVLVTGGAAGRLGDAALGPAVAVVPDLVLEGLVLAWRDQAEP